MPMASTFRARVRKGRLVLDEPTDLPEGAEVDLVPLEEISARSPAGAARIVTPRLERPEDAADFELAISTDPTRDGV